MAARIPSPKFSQPSGYKDAMHLPRPFKIRRYYTPEEVAQHNTGDDCHVSFFHEVFDLTKLLSDNHESRSELCQPLIKVAGCDITHWFDRNTKEVSNIR